MTIVLVATVFLAAAPLVVTPKLSLEIGSVRSVEETHTLEVHFRAGGSADVYFNRRAVQLEIRDSKGDLVRYGCGDKRDISPDYARLHPGETTSRTLDLGCYHLEHRKKYTVTAVFDDGGDDVRGEAPAGAVWAIGPVRSNSIVTQPGEPHNKPLQADGAARRR
jgi:hypothetical protein